MRLTALALAALVVDGVNGMPFKPLDVGLQQERRRAIDYSLTAAAAQPLNHRRAKRSVGYSVVQVDGGNPPSSTAAPPPPPPAATVVQTVTSAGPPPSPNTQTVVITTTIPGPGSAQTIVMTTTQEMSATVTATPTALATTSLPPSLSIASASATPTQSIVPITSLVIDRVTSTAVASQPTAYYDDGLWHTYYPVKNFMPPESVIMSSAAPATVVSQGSSTTAGHTSGVNNWASSSIPAPLSTTSSRPWSTSMWSASTSWSSWTPSSATYSSYTPSSVAHPSNSPTQSQWSSTRPSLNATSWQTLQARKAPADLKVANWDVSSDFNPSAS